MPEQNENRPQTPPLGGAEKSAMRSLLQTLDPAVFVGKKGVTPAIIAEIETAFKTGELIKVKFSGDRDSVAGQIARVAEATGAEIVGSTGKVAGFLRAAPDDGPGE